MLRAYPRSDGGGIVSLKFAVCRACGEPIGEAAPGSLIRLKCRNRRCNVYNVIEVTKAGLIRTHCEA